MTKENTNENTEEKLNKKDEQLEKSDLVAEPKKEEAEPKKEEAEPVKPEEAEPVKPEEAEPVKPEEAEPVEGLAEKVEEAKENITKIEEKLSEELPELPKKEDKPSKVGMWLGGGAVALGIGALAFMGLAGNKATFAEDILAMNHISEGNYSVSYKMDSSFFGTQDFKSEGVFKEVDPGEEEYADGKYIYTQNADLTYTETDHYDGVEKPVEGETTTNHYEQVATEDKIYELEDINTFNQVKTSETEPAEITETEESTATETEESTATETEESTATETEERNVFIEVDRDASSGNIATGYDLSILHHIEATGNALLEAALNHVSVEVTKDENGTLTIDENSKLAGVVYDAETKTLTVPKTYGRLGANAVIRSVQGENLANLVAIDDVISYEDAGDKKEQTQYVITDEILETLPANMTIDVVDGNKDNEELVVKSEKIDGVKYSTFYVSAKDATTVMEERADEIGDDFREMLRSYLQEPNVDFLKVCASKTTFKILLEDDPTTTREDVQTNADLNVDEHDYIEDELKTSGEEISDGKNRPATVKVDLLKQVGELSITKEHKEGITVEVPTTYEIMTLDEYTDFLLEKYRQQDEEVIDLYEKAMEEVEAEGELEEVDPELDKDISMTEVLDKAQETEQEIEQA